MPGRDGFPRRCRSRVACAAEGCLTPGDSNMKEITVKIAPHAVREQLAAILTSENFVRSRRMQRFLEFIVEETLAGRADQLAEYSIGLAVFDRGTDFEPALDPIVRNDARRLRLKLLEYYRQPG